jgi:hypothetical protein
MTSDLINKVESTARRLRFQGSKDYKNQGHTKLNYESDIAFNMDYPKNVFLINKNMIFEKGLKDSSYDVFKFDEDGKYEKMPVQSVDLKFFNKIKVIKTI